MKVKNYKELNVWMKGMIIVDKVYALTKKFPSEELYGLVTQLRRSSVSVPSNIAEGFARNSTKEYIQFLYVALGSCAELETQLMISQRQNYIKEEELKNLSEDVDHENRMLMNLIKSLK